MFWTKVLRGKKKKKESWECSGLKMVEERRKKEKKRLWLRGWMRKKEEKKKILERKKNNFNSMLKLKLLSIFITIFLQYFHNKS